MNSSPLVSVICLCYNHSDFVVEALQSVIQQDYLNCELVVVDDASTDGSAAVIKEFIATNPHIKFISLTNNVGNCKAFNEGLKHVHGEFIIDLAADDVLMPSRITVGVHFLQTLNSKYGVHFSDAEYIAKDGTTLYLHSDRYPHDSIPQGDIYISVIERYFICPPTVMFRKTVIDKLGGYDESLAYEDFDFWVRSSREFLYAYSPIPLVKKRLLKNSLSAKQFRPLNSYLYSNYRICRKAIALNRKLVEREALSRRIAYELRVAAKFLNFKLALKFGLLWLENKTQKFN